MQGMGSTIIQFLFKINWTNKSDMKEFFFTFIERSKRVVVNGKTFSTLLTPLVILKSKSFQETW